MQLAILLLLRITIIPSVSRRLHAPILSSCYHEQSNAEAVLIVFIGVENLKY